MTTLSIKSLCDAAWKLLGFQQVDAIADRDDFRAEMEMNLGPETASEIQRQVDVDLGRLRCDMLPTPESTAMSEEFFELLSLEAAIQETADRIDSAAIFNDADDRLLATLGLSWNDNVLPLLDERESPGHMLPNNVETFLAMVQTAKQQIPAEKESAECFRRRRRDLVRFLERAVKVGEGVWAAT